MRNGLLWFDRNEPGRLQRAADRCLEKFGVWPEVCYLNGADLPGGPAVIEGLCAVPAANVPPGHVWIELAAPVSTALTVWE